MLYSLVDHLQSRVFGPMSEVAERASEVTKQYSQSPFARCFQANSRIFGQWAKRHPKPDWGIDEVNLGGGVVPVSRETIWSGDFCDCIHFRKTDDSGLNQSKVLVVAPMSGHYSTLVRDTVRTLLPDVDVYVTDWINAMDVEVSGGGFGFENYIEYLISILGTFDQRIHIVGVCQPAVQVLLTTAMLCQDASSIRPRSIILSGGPVDPRANPTSISSFASEKPLSWFERYCVARVPFGYSGVGREVYPGFLQLAGFIGIDVHRHSAAYRDALVAYVEHEQWSTRHFEFYDEYLAVMDLDAQFYLETIDRVFQRNLLASNSETYGGAPIDIGAIEDVGVLTVEGDRDNISALGQTRAAHDLCSNLPAQFHETLVAEGVGHYGIFSGSSFRKCIAPQMLKFIQQHS